MRTEPEETVLDTRFGGMSAICAGSVEMVEVPFERDLAISSEQQS